MSETIAVGTDIEIIPNLPDALPTNDEYSSPIVIRQIAGDVESIIDSTSGVTAFKNTVFAGSFVCDDTRDDSMMIFITAYRGGDAADVSHHYSGYGIALRMLTAVGAADSKLSLFVVDNSLAERDVILENVLHTGWGDYAYLNATSHPFTADTQYNFQIKYLDNGGIDFYVWAAGGSIPGSPSISYGAYTAPQSQGTYYGVSCSNTGGYQNVVKSISLSNLKPNYAILYCNINGNDMPSTFTAIADAYAMTTGSPYDVGIHMRVYNHLNGQWDVAPFLADHNFGIGSGTEIRLSIPNLMRSEHLDVQGYVDILLVSEFASDFPTDVDVLLYADDVFLESYSTDFVHIGGDTDVWVHDSDGLSLMEFDIYNIGVKEWFLSSNTKITGSFWLPVMIIKEVVSINALGIETGILVPIVDWDFAVHKEDWRFSAREENYMNFRAGLAGTNVRVKFYTPYKIMAADLMLQSILNEPHAYDILARCKIPYDVYIELDIVASIQPSAIMGHVYDYINLEHRDTLVDTDINIYLQAQDGISDANVTLLYAYKHELSGTVNTITSVDGVLTLEDPEIDQFISINDTARIVVTVL